MELKIFGKSLFEYKGKGDNIFAQAVGRNKESEFLPDFNTLQNNDFSDFLVMDGPNGATAFPIKKKGRPADKIELTPKGVHQLKMLNDDSFQVNTDPEYVDGQLADFKDKLALLKVSEFDMTRGLTEITSIIARMENRKKYAEFAHFFEQFPYTTNVKIVELTKTHDYLQLGKVEQFIADMPKEATQAMKDYTAKVKELCDKKPLFYIIANKKDFKKTEKRRDPILLAQSPYGHFWQILGAWDEEMLLLEEL